MVVWDKIVINCYQVRVTQTNSSCYDNNNEWYMMFAGLYLNSKFKSKEAVG